MEHSLVVGDPVPEDRGTGVEGSLGSAPTPRPKMEGSPAPTPTPVPEPEGEGEGEGPSWAELADVDRVYELALQPNPKDDVNFYLERYQALHGSGRLPLVLREDFAGTMLVSREWARTLAERTAYAVDNDRHVLEWGDEHNLRNEPEALSKRVTPILSDVLELEATDEVKEAPYPVPAGGIPLCDVIAANNYSHQCFKKDETYLRYLSQVRAALAPGGIFVCDLCGGLECHTNSKEELATHDIPLSNGETAMFTYQYEQVNYNPETREQGIRVSFRFHDGSWQREAFAYEWRVFTVAELQQLGEDAGFTRSKVYVDNSAVECYSHGHRECTDVAALEAEEFFSCYIVFETGP